MLATLLLVAGVGLPGVGADHEGPADLVVRDVDIDVGDRDDHEPTEVHAEIVNEGAQRAPESTVALLLDGELNKTQRIGELFDGQDAYVEFEFETPEPGEHTVRIVADWNDTVEEASEENNWVLHRFTVHAPGPANLEIMGVGTDPEPLVDGDAASISAKVRNDGGSESGNFQIRADLDGEALVVRRADSLPPGTTRTISLADWRASSGAHTLDVVVDSADEVEELNETDNVASFSIDVLEDPPPADVSVQDVSVRPETVFEGQAVGLSIRVVNAGAATGPIALGVQIEDTPDDLRFEQTVRVCGRCTTTIDTGPIWNATAGEHRFEVEIDARNALDEADEADNEHDGVLHVRERADPAVLDLRAEQMGTGLPGPANVSHPWSGKRLSIDLANEGDGDLFRPLDVHAVACPINGTIEPTLEGTGCEQVLAATLHALEAGTNETLTAGWDTQGKLGTWEICASVVYDPPQGSASNDRLCEPVHVLVPADGIGGRDLDG